MKMDNSNLSRQVMKGIGWAALASVMWGISGTVLQLISQNLAIPATWMLSTRTLITGVILLAISFCIYGKRTFDVFKTKETAISVVTYAIFGLMLNLLTFYYAYSNDDACHSPYNDAVSKHYYLFW